MDCNTKAWSSSKGLRPRKRISFLTRLLIIAAMAIGGGAMDAKHGTMPAPPVAQARGWNMLWPDKLNAERMKELGQWASGSTTRALQAAMVDNKGDSPLITTGDRINIISANIHALNPRIEEVAMWEADILLLQETKLAAHAIKDATGVAKDNGWAFIHGKPCKMATRSSSKTRASTEANSGGVAAMVRRPRRPITHKLDRHAADLHETARWLEVKTARGKGGGCLTTSTVYGISGANSCQRKKKQNEALLADALTKLIQAGDDPYILMGDLNIDPENSPAIAAAVDAGLVVDVGHLWARDVTVDEEGRECKHPEPTYCKDGPSPGMSGPGVSRIDVVLANPVAAAAVKDFVLRWDLVQENHVPLQITLDLGELDAQEVVQKTRGHVDVEGLPDQDDQVWQQAMSTARDVYGPRLQSALDKRDVNEAHLIWNYMAEACLKFATGWDRAKAESWLAAFPPRGGAPRFVKRQRKRLVDRLDNPAPYRQRRTNKIRNKLVDLRSRLRTWDDGSCHCTPWKDDLNQGDLGFEVKLWDDIEDKLNRLIGKHNLKTLVSDRCHGLPTFRDMDGIITYLVKEHDKEGTQARIRRSTEKRSMLKWDWEKNYGRRAFADSTINYPPPNLCDTR